MSRDPVPPPNEFDERPDDTTQAPSNRGTGRAPRWRLLVFSDSAVETFDLPIPGAITLGRAAEASLRIGDPSISRLHASLVVEARGHQLTIEIEDLGSANGTRVRGLPLMKGERVRVAPGEVFELGSTSMMIQGGDPGVASIARGQTPSEPRSLTLVTAPEGRMASLLRVVDRIAPSDLTVLILGETGVGKEVMAEAIHERSRRSKRPFLRLNCAALTESLLESELFGHERGAFTGAVNAKPGLLEAADGGTVFLDEIGELPLPTQVKLLRVLEERQVRPVGAVRSRAVDLRFIAATNRDLEADAQRGKFRLDLYYRLNGVSILIPPLRDRRVEIEPLATTFASAARARSGVPGEASFGPGLMANLEAHDWPGNIRELRNVVERAVLLAGAGPIELEHLSLGRASIIGEDSRTPRPSLEPAPKGPVLDEERQRIMEALDRCAGNQTRAATMLGISRSTLVARLDAYGVARPRKR